MDTDVRELSFDKREIETDSPCDGPAVDVLLEDDDKNVEDEEFNDKDPDELEDDDFEEEELDIEDIEDFEEDELIDDDDDDDDDPNDFEEDEF